jgi:hypothetical protein
VLAALVLDSCATASEMASLRSVVQKEDASCASRRLIAVPIHVCSEALGVGTTNSGKRVAKSV